MLEIVLDISCLFGANIRILEYVLSGTDIGEFSKSFPKNRHFSFLPHHLPLFLAVFGVAPEHVDSNIIVRISRGGIR